MKEQEVCRWRYPQKEKPSVSEKIISHYAAHNQSLLGGE